MDVRQRRILHRSIWLAVVFAAILYAPAEIVFGERFWRLPGIDAWIVCGFAAVFLTSACLSALLDSGKQLVALCAGSTGAAAILMLALLADVGYSKRVLLIALALFTVGLTAPLVRKRSALALVSSVVALAIVVSRPSVSYSTLQFDRRSQETVTIQASQHTLRATYYSGYVERHDAAHVTGGAVTPDPGGDGYYMVTPLGRLYRLRWNDGRLDVEGLRADVPINHDEFLADADPAAANAVLRVADLLVRTEGDTTALYASHHYWHRAEACVTVRVSVMTLREAGVAAGTVRDWTTLFESEPCLPLTIDRGLRFAGEQVGGNLEALGPEQLLLTVGDHQFDGWYKLPDLVSDASTSYGKSILIATRTGATTPYTTGHRNPQGLVVGPDGAIWATEHGPQGGDELNLLRAGNDYGHPQTTLGTDYGNVVWPLSRKSAKHSTRVAPVYAWVPSIGISDLLVLDDPAFPRWRGDLIVASLAGKSLWRVRVRDGRVLYAEPIALGERIRDIATAGSGELVALTDSLKIVRLTPARDLEDGSILFANKCGGCHDDEENRIGPTLASILGKPIAAEPGYEYSPALKTATGRWTRDQLDRFLADPAATVPGTKMLTDGVADPQARAQLIDYMSLQFQ